MLCYMSVRDIPTYRESTDSLILSLYTNIPYISPIPIQQLVSFPDPRKLRWRVWHITIRGSGSTVGMCARVLMWELGCELVPKLVLTDRSQSIVSTIECCKWQSVWNPLTLRRPFDYQVSK